MCSCSIPIVALECVEKLFDKIWLLFSMVPGILPYENVNNENYNFIGPPNENYTFHRKIILDNPGLCNARVYSHGYVEWKACLSVRQCIQ